MTKCPYCSALYAKKGWYYRHILKKHPRTMRAKMLRMHAPGLRKAMQAVI